MKTIRRLLYGEVILAVILVTLGFVTLFYFFDFVEELQAVGKYRETGYTVAQALTEADRADALRILSAIGTCEELQAEHHLDLMTATVGAGPATRTLPAV